MNAITIYWMSNSVISLLTLVSALSYFFHKATIDGVVELGFPNFFRVQLGVLKVAAAVVLVLPYFPDYAKEWAYAGIGLFLVTAMVAHTANKDPIALSLISLAAFIILAISNIYFHRVM